MWPGWCLEAPKDGSSRTSVEDTQRKGGKAHEPLVVVDWLETDAFSDQGFADVDEMAPPLEVAPEADRSDKVIRGIFEVGEGSGKWPRR